MKEYTIKVDYRTEQKIDAARGPVSAEVFISRTVREAVKDIAPYEDEKNPYSSVIRLKEPIRTEGKLSYEYLTEIPIFVQKALRLKNGELLRWEITKTGDVLLRLSSEYDPTAR